MLELTHHNDGKEKWQSHEVSLADFDDMQYQMPFDFSDIRGYGETVEEARENFNKEFFKMYDRLTAFAKLLDTDALRYIEVDCFGKPVKK